MKPHRSMLAMATMMSLGAAAVAIPEPSYEPEPGSARNRPSGNTPVPGGGNRECERRKAKLLKARMKAEGRDNFDDEDQF